MSDLPDGWAWTTLGEIAEVVGGVTKDSARQTDPSFVEVPYLRVANVQRGYLDLQNVAHIRVPAEKAKALELHAGDVLFNEGGDRDKLGRGWVWTGAIPGCIHQNHVFRARLRSKEINPKLLSWYGNEQGRAFFESRGKQTTNLASISMTNLKKLPVPLPPAAEQERIVAAIEKHFSHLEAGVDSLDRARRSLKRMRSTVLQGAVEGRLVPQDPTDEPAASLLTRIAEERRRMWCTGEVPGSASRRQRKYSEPVLTDASNLPALPVGWAWCSWEQIGFCQDGRPFPSSDYSTFGVKLLRPGNLDQSGRVVWTSKNTKMLPGHYADERNGLLVGSSELVMNLTAQSLKEEFLGRVCLTGPSDSCLLNQRLARLTPVLASRRYLLWMFKSRHFRRFVDGLNKGSLIQHMFTSQLSRFVLPLPPLEEQERIAREVEKHLTVLDSIEKTLDVTTQRSGVLRRAVLTRAFSGGLVPQDTDDEPAADILERIATARQTAATPRRQTRRSTT